MRRFGSGPPIVILHGLFGSGRNWDAIAKRLADAWSVHELDLRNHGDAPWAAAMDYRAQAADVARTIEAEIGAPATLVGHSMGGKAAMTLALDQPELVERLVVVDMAPAPSRATLLPFAEAMRAIDPEGLKRRSEVDALLASSVPDAGVRAFLLQNLVPVGEGLRWRVNLDAVIADMDDIMGFPDFPADARYVGPTRFIAGARSPYLGPNDLELIRGRFPEAELDVVADAGHWVHAEQPAAFLARLRAFLETAA